jgi:DNA-directed RNA polymerase I subunit RPA1
LKLKKVKQVIAVSTDTERAEASGFADGDADESVIAHSKESAEDGYDKERRRGRKSEAVSYDDAEEEDMEAVRADEMRQREQRKAGRLVESETDADAQSDDSQDLSTFRLGDHSAATKKSQKKLQTNPFSQKRLLGSDEMLRDYNFNQKELSAQISIKVRAEEKKLLMVGMVENLAAHFVIRSIPGISRSFLLTSNNGQYNVQTEGVNFQAVWNYDEIIDVNKISCNDIYAVLKTYGVEAARRAITMEIGGVFSVYSIEVDPRHLFLIADYMTFEGGYRPFNRVGMSASTSPYQKMSFETTSAFLTDATMRGDYDLIKSASASLVVGKPMEGGTGCFELLQPLNLDQEK